jgi:hypothetical protein
MSCLKIYQLRKKNTSGLSQKLALVVNPNDFGGMGIALPSLLVLYWVFGSRGTVAILVRKSLL